MTKGNQPNDEIEGVEGKFDSHACPIYEVDYANLRMWRLRQESNEAQRRKRISESKDSQIMFLPLVQLQNPLGR